MMQLRLHMARRSQPLPFCTSVVASVFSPVFPCIRTPHVYACVHFPPLLSRVPCCVQVRAAELPGEPGDWLLDYLAPHVLDGMPTVMHWRR